MNERDRVRKKWHKSNRHGKGTKSRENKINYVRNFGIFQSKKINCFVRCFPVTAFVTDDKIAFVE